MSLAKGFGVIPPSSLRLVPAASVLQLSPYSECQPLWQKRAGRTALLHQAKSSAIYKQLFVHKNAFSQKKLTREGNAHPPASQKPQKQPLPDAQQKVATPGQIADYGKLSLGGGSWGCVLHWPVLPKVRGAAAG